MNIGAHLVDMSPLSTTGAVCIAAIADPAEVRPTYNKLLAWGLSMTVVGAHRLLPALLTPRGRCCRLPYQFARLPGGRFRLRRAAQNCYICLSVGRHPVLTVGDRLRQAGALL